MATTTLLLSPPWLVYFASIAIFTAVGALAGALAGRGAEDVSVMPTLAVTFFVLAFVAFTPVWVMWQIAYWLAH